MKAAGEFHGEQIKSIIEDVAKEILYEVLPLINFNDQSQRAVQLNASTLGIVSYPKWQVKQPWTI